MYELFQGTHTPRLFGGFCAAISRNCLAVAEKETSNLACRKMIYTLLWVYAVVNGSGNNSNKDMQGLQGERAPLMKRYSARDGRSLKSSERPPPKILYAHPESLRIPLWEEKVIPGVTPRWGSGRLRQRQQSRSDRSAPGRLRDLRGLAWDASEFATVEEWTEAGRLGVGLCEKWMEVGRTCGAGPKEIDPQLEHVRSVSQ
ncbi:hypothetical protein NDU88_004747 [Pleurodeles waltl]|uniref:Uncharacterized protein n=1 Tax=Pleurodeles waltl TaxID=8319 RepID=A0AAV7UK47_PLEWA|nr:hypothetical protein NDU88_004747 [Pleurodeles waltl]